MSVLPDHLAPVRVLFVGNSLTYVANLPAVLEALSAANGRRVLPIAYVIGVVFLCGGVAASFMIPAPAWFIALDLLVAYLPMAWLGIRMGARLQTGNAVAPLG